MTKINKNISLKLKFELDQFKKSQKDVFKLLSNVDKLPDSLFFESIFQHFLDEEFLKDPPNVLNFFPDQLHEIETDFFRISRYFDRYEFPDCQRFLSTSVGNYDKDYTQLRSHLQSFFQNLSLWKEKIHTFADKFSKSWNCPRIQIDSSFVPFDTMSILELRSILNEILSIIQILKTDLDTNLLSFLD